ncbi:MAG TPA: Hsp20/alpha crystallin family protein [Methanomassiliicoccales archaeon]|jgi:HSP20 family protein|nr:Hsp20/alpha crystallin family protein [Euryarchaeota archaeon]HOE52130.1 Hsp20/alpha crystallin family protein [Methanomassiliicoccales archaeon]HOO04262.1 Hsp20/alpha crystallin family protein [Methanomassiliicoccales archaeon]HPD08197.1 Hsp20/alpha crystallin family protein [Methanomassiliicoccales archaeon]HQM67030.1 Hsp20/alpha crystallin family protein [Methanomassiliicoccales archaeon]
MRRMRRDDDWSGLFRSFDEEFDAMRERMDRLMEAALRGTGENPLVYGFSMRTGPDGRPMVQEFGNVPRGGGLPPDTSYREPLTDVVEEEGRVKVIVELPGVEKKDIDLRAEDRQLTISVDTERKRFNKTLELPCEVRPESASAEYRNGVLTVYLDRVPSVPKGRKIDIK